MSDVTTARFCPLRSSAPLSVLGAVSVVDGIVSVVEGAVAVVDAARLGCDEGDGVKMSSLSSSKTGGRKLSSGSITLLLQGRT